MWQVLYFWALLKAGPSASGMTRLGGLPMTAAGERGIQSNYKNWNRYSHYTRVAAYPQERKENYYKRQVHLFDPARWLYHL